VLRTYTIEQLVKLGVSWVWMGLEGEDSQYTKLRGVDVRDMIRRMQSHGIRVLGSSIIGLESHTPENIDEAIDFAVRYNTAFHQFMLYTPIHGTPLHAELTAKGLMKEAHEFDEADIHGQQMFNYRHPHIKDGLETELIKRAFQRDFEVNGPSVVRVFRTTLAGWKRYKNHPDDRIRRRYAYEAKGLATTFSAAVAGAKHYYRKNPEIHAKMAEVLSDLNREFGLVSRLSSFFGKWYVLWKIRREERRLADGWTYEPPTFYEKNFDDNDAAPCRYVSSRAAAAVSEVDAPAEQAELMPVG
jgi:hypothetical protein